MKASPSIFSSSLFVGMDVPKHTIVFCVYDSDRYHRIAGSPTGPYYDSVVGFMHAVLIGGNTGLCGKR